MIVEEIARLTGTLKFNVDNRPLMAFEKRLEKVTGQLQQFGAIANKKYNIKVSLDSRSLRAQLEKAANAKIVFKHFSASEDAIVALSRSMQDRLSRAPIVLRNIKVNLTDLLEQRKIIRTTLGKATMELPVALKFKQAEAQLRAWKNGTESKYKLHINADISQAKFIANVRRSLKSAGGKIGEMKIDIKDPKVRLQVDRDNLREQIRKAIEQHAFKIKVQADSTVRGGSSRAARRGRSEAIGGGIMGAGMGFMRGAIPGLGAAFALSQLNQINQQMQGQRLAMTAVTGSEAEGKRQTQWVRDLGDSLGFDFRQVGPSYNKMLASGKTSGMSTEAVQGIFKGVTEYGRVMGLDTESMKGSMKAIEQMMNKGQVMSEELKGQLAERMPGAMSAMAEAAGFGTDDKGVAKLMDAMQKGQVKSGAVLEKFAAVLAKRAREGGALEKAMESTSAQQARFNNAFSEAVEVFSAAGFDRGMGQFFKRMADGIRTAEPFIQGLGEAFDLLINPVNAIINTGAQLLTWFAQLGEVLGISKGQFLALAGVASVFLVPFGGIIAAVAAAALAFDDLMTYLEGGESVLGDWLAATPEAQAAFDNLAESSSKFGENIKYAFERVGELAPALKGLSFSDVLISTMKELDALLKAFNSVVDRFVAAGVFAQETNQTGTGLEANLRNMVAMIRGPEWANEQSNAAVTERAQQRDTMAPTDVPGRESLKAEDIAEAVRQAIMTQDNASGVIGGVKVEVPIVIQGSLLDAGDLATTLQKPITDIATRAFTQQIENAIARQKDDR